MRSIMIGSLALAASASSPPNKMMLFENFMNEFDRHYETEFDKGQRFQIFSQNIDIIYESNAKNLTYTLGVTANADKTWEEFRAEYLTGFKPAALTATKEDRPTFSAPQEFTEPDSVDWVTKGGVTSVKNQGTCGSCWTFSTVGALEGAMFVAGRKLEDLSMQKILACDKGGNGCKGGGMDQAFGWVQQNGLPALTDDPYLCKDASAAACTGMKCLAGAKPEPLLLAVGDVTKHTDVATTENALEAAVAQQPVSVAIEADKSVFQHYTGGVLTNDACGSQLDHGVLAVGYGTDKGQKYWKVKNSWGTVFGESGYIRIEKGSASDGGECGIRKMASFPTVKAAGNREVIV